MTAERWEQYASDAFQNLFREVQRFTRYVYILHLLSWDQETYMPPGGTEARARQISTLASLVHQEASSPRIGELLAQAEADAQAQGWPPDSDGMGFLREFRRRYDRMTKVPVEWVRAFTQLTSEAQVAWRQAKAESNFARFAPYLKRIVDMKREYAQFFAPYDHIYDPLLDEFEPGMKTAEVQAVFDRLREVQVPLIQTIRERPQVSDEVLYRPFPVDKQRAFVREVLAHIGFDFHRGRVDESAHPFTTSFSINDVRLTIRTAERDFFRQALYSGLHEMGHGLYVQGVDPAYEETPLMGGASLGVHESQSRLWENLVGRSRAFVHWLLPRLQAAFPGTIDDVDVETLYRAINRVEPSYIRIEADEVTYNLHIMLRFELEVALLEGRLQVEDLPQAWNERMQAYLGLTPPDDAHGVLQDIHWSQGALGYFPTYTLGNVMSVQIWERMAQDIPDVDAKMQAGQFQDVLAWLQEHVYRPGAKFPPKDLLRRVTGQALNPEPYLAYLRRKFGEIYGF
ncbi:MAG: carboxypeptidase M32 [Chloroflexi bacterium]|nr:carboxypeptidase M32 [Chloroflexota bacterium]